MDTAALASLLAAHSPLAVGAAFLGGVVTSLTPCLYPMIPITLAVVGGASDHQAPSRNRRIALALTYVVGLSFTYALLGLVAGLTGSLFGAVSTTPWLFFVMANVMLLAAAMMADILPVPIPASWQQRAAGVGTGGRFAGVFGMGAVSGLVAAPCGAPVLAVLLTWVASTHSALLGFLYLFAFSLGMCTLLVVVAIAADGTMRLPRAGAWMVRVKRTVAFILLGVAEYYLISMGTLLI